MKDITEYKYKIDYYKDNPDKYRINSNGSVADVKTGRIIVSQHAPGLYDPIMAEKHKEASVKATASGRDPETIRARAIELVQGKLAQRQGLEHTMDKHEIIAYGLSHLFMRSIDEDEKLSDAVKANSYVTRMIVPELEPDRSGSVPTVAVQVNISESVADSIAGRMQRFDDGYPDGE
jgi:hypothetical protein